MPFFVNRFSAAHQLPRRSFLYCWRRSLFSIVTSSPSCRRTPPRLRPPAPQVPLELDHHPSRSRSSCIFKRLSANRLLSPSQRKNRDRGHDGHRWQPTLPANMAAVGCRPATQHCPHRPFLFFRIFNHIFFYFHFLYTAPTTSRPSCRPGGLLFLWPLRCVCKYR